LYNNETAISAAASRQTASISVEHDDIDRRNRLTKYQRVMS